MDIYISNCCAESSFDGCVPLNGSGLAAVIFFFNGPDLISLFFL